MSIDSARYAGMSDPEARLPAPNYRASLARRLDREADVELFAGHHLRAEYLAQRAFALREDGR